MQQKCRLTGADPGSSKGGGALVYRSTSTPINHVFFFFGRIPVVLEKPQVISVGGGGGGGPAGGAPPAPSP